MCRGSVLWSNCHKACLIGAPPPLKECLCHVSIDEAGSILARHCGVPRIQLGVECVYRNRVEIYQTADGGPVEVGDRVGCMRHAHPRGCGGELHIGLVAIFIEDPRIESYKAPIQIGSRWGSAARCAILSSIMELLRLNIMPIRGL